MVSTIIMITIVEGQHFTRGTDHDLPDLDGTYQWVGVYVETMHIL